MLLHNAAFRADRVGMMRYQRRSVRWVGAIAAAAASLLAGYSAAETITPAGAAVVPSSGKTTELHDWGSFGNDAGAHEIGDAPVPISLSGASVIQASNSTDYAIVNGQEYAWGSGSNGQLGNGARRDSFSKPVKVDFPRGTTVTAIGDAYNSGFAVDLTGQAWSWGRNLRQDLCRKGRHLRPGLIRSLPRVTAVAGGGNHTLWLTQSGHVYTCGYNEYGDLGDGKHANSTSPVEVPGLSDVVAVSAAWRSSAALTASGELFMWGVNNVGDLGIGNDTSQDRPHRVPGTFSQVYVGGSWINNSHTIAITTAGTVEEWGTGYGNRPVLLHLPFAVSRVMAGGGESGAVDTTGGVWMWGSSFLGAVGNRKTNGYTVRPVKVDEGRTELSGTGANVVDS
jgi:alpha-tubulin suppressor-like RCC1 family protein